MREYLSRLIGWSNTEALDSAELMLELALERKLPLVIAGSDNLPAIAYEIHRRSNPGPMPPFVVCDPRRRDKGEYTTVRAAPSCSLTAEAIERARGGGTICVISRRLPPDFLALRARLRGVRLFVCREGAPTSIAEIEAITVPRLRTRADRARVVLAAASEQGITDPADVLWLLDHASDSHDELAKGCVRLSAVRGARTMSETAASVGMAAISLQRWITRRGGNLAPDPRSRYARHVAPSDCTRWP